MVYEEETPPRGAALAFCCQSIIAGMKEVLKERLPADVNVTPEEMITFTPLIREWIKAEFRGRKKSDKDAKTKDIIWDLAEKYSQSFKNISKHVYSKPR